MIAASVAVFLHLVLLAVSGHIHLAPEDRLKGFESFLRPFAIYPVAVVEEFLYAEHVSMVGYGHTLHSVANSLVNESRNTRLSVEYRVVCMYM